MSVPPGSKFWFISVRIGFRSFSPSLWCLFKSWVSHRSFGLRWRWIRCTPSPFQYPFGDDSICGNFEDVIYSFQVCSCALHLKNSAETLFSILSRRDGCSGYVPIPRYSTSRCVQWMLLPLTDLHLLLWPRSYAEPFWKGPRDDRFLFSWFTPSNNTSLASFFAAIIMVAWVNTAVSVNIYNQCYFPVLPYPRHFHRVGLPIVVHRLSQHRPRSSSGGVPHEIVHLFRFWITVWTELLRSERSRRRWDSWIIRIWRSISLPK